METIGAIILAAGKGTRMQADTQNKVVYPLANKPMIMHTVSSLKELLVNPLIVVVGFAKESVQKALEGVAVVFAEQTEQLGTGHALSCGLEKLPNHISSVLVCNGDDSAFYTKTLLEKLVTLHSKSHAAITFLTLDVSDPTGLGRIVRGDDGSIQQIIEEKDATADQKKISEINPACYIFDTKFLRTYISQIPKNPTKQEYYIVSLIELAVKNGQKVEALHAGKMPWRGVNTPEELAKAEALFAQKTYGNN